MSQSYEPTPHQQRGDILLEALIGILLMAIVGLGITFATSRAANSQRNMKLQNIVVNQMRSLLEQNGALLCSNAALLVVSIPTQAAPLKLVATCGASPTATVGGITLTGGTTLTSVVLTTNSTDSGTLGGIISVGDDT